MEKPDWGTQIHFTLLNITFKVYTRTNERKKGVWLTFCVIKISQSNDHCHRILELDICVKRSKKKWSKVENLAVWVEFDAFLQLWMFVANICSILLLCKRKYLLIKQFAINIFVLLPQWFWVLSASWFCFRFIRTWASRKTSMWWIIASYVSATITAGGGTFELLWVATIIYE